MSSRVTPQRLGGGLLLLAAAACTNVGGDLGFGPLQENHVTVLVYLDRDGSRSTSPLDTVFANARVALLARAGEDTLRTATSDKEGLAQFARVPLGEYRVAIVPSSIGDSIEVQDVDESDIRVEVGDDTVGVVARLGYPEVTIAEARGLPPGERVFIRGIILAGVQSFRDMSSHVSDKTGYLRLTQVSLRGGLTGNNPGDSVTVLGVTNSALGQPTLDLAIIARLLPRPEPIPVPVSTATAATADGGVLDAALVLLTGATITDTVTQAPDFKVTVTDGSGSLEILLDANINFPRSQFRPLRSLNARGVLVPNGVGGWYFKPRVVSDVVLN